MPRDGRSRRSSPSCTTSASTTAASCSSRTWCSPATAPPTRRAVDVVAEATLDVLYRHVPAAVPGIVFLSGGQPDLDATAHLDAMNRRGPHPWQLSFSFARALQSPAMAAWGGDLARAAAAQELRDARAPERPRPRGRLQRGARSLSPPPDSAVRRQVVDADAADRPGGVVRRDPGGDRLARG